MRRFLGRQENKKQKRKQKDMDEGERLFAEKKERKRRDDLERKLRDQREKEGRELSQIVPVHGAVRALRSPRAGVGRIPVQADRVTWGMPTRPEFRAELDASSSSTKQATRPYELEARNASQQLNSNTQSRQRPIQQGQLRRTTQRFELMGNFPGENSHSPQLTKAYHPAAHQETSHSMAPLQPRERPGGITPSQAKAIKEAYGTRNRKPVHYPPGFFENPRTPPDISKYTRAPSELNRW